MARMALGPSPQDCRKCLGFQSPQRVALSFNPSPLRAIHRFTPFFFLILALAATSMAFFIHAASRTESSTTSAGTS